MANAVRAASRRDDRTGLINVALFESRPIIATGVDLLLSATDGVRVIYHTTDPRDIGHCAEDPDVDVMVLGLGDASEDVVQACVERLTSPSSDQCPPPSVWIMRRPFPVSVARGLRARILISSTASADRLRDAVTNAHRSRGMALLHLHSDAGPREVADDPVDQLTDRERQVLFGLAAGLSSKQLARSLGISVNTVRTHVQRVLGKLGVNSRLEAAAVAATIPRRAGEWDGVAR